MWNCCSCILFYVIWQKRVKHSMACGTIWRRRGCSLVCGTEVFHSNSFNRNRHITTILFSLNLVWKIGYYTFYIITMSQHILEIWTTLECLSLCVATVMCSKNAYMWYVKCKFTNCRYVEVLIKWPCWQIHHDNLFYYIFFSSYNYICRRLTQLTLFLFIERESTIQNKMCNILIDIKTYGGDKI